MELVRGNSPLRPQIAERLGMAKNTSYLAKLFAGYRSGYAGLKDLVPGDANGIGMNSGIIRDYVERFYNGEEDYQDDEKWFDLVKQAEMARHGGTPGSTTAGGTPPIILPTPGEPQPPTTPGEDGAGTGKAVEPVPTGEEYEIDKTLSRTYELDIDGITIGIYVKARIDKRLPGKDPFCFEATGTKVEYNYNPLHPIFSEKS